VFDCATTTETSPARQRAVGSPKRDRRLTLTKIDKRGRLGKRIAELTAMFASGEQTPMRKLKVEKAARLTALAELGSVDEFTTDELFGIP